MKKKYYNDAFIGNQNITASLSKYGELLRLYYPNPDYRQYSDFFHVGLKINDSNIIYLHSDVNNRYNQYYTENTNVLNTEIENTYFNLKILQTDAVMIGKDIIIKKLTFTNNNVIDLKMSLIINSKVISSYNNMAGSIFSNNALIQYSHNFTFAITSNKDALSHQLNNLQTNIESGIIYDKDYIGMNSESAISYDIENLKPGESSTIYIYMYLNYDETKIEETKQEIDEIRKINAEKEIQKVESYWKKFLAKHDTIKLNSENNSLYEKEQKVYKRTILYMPFLINEKTGGISASLEVDEERDKSGRYSYCWIRDAVLIYDALDELNFNEYSKKFYDNFLKNTQNKNGMWEQRFYTDERLAPCWGYQIDETATAVWGFYKRYKKEEKITGKKNIKFLKNNLRVMERAMDFLNKYTNYVLNKEEKEDKVRIELEKTYNYKERDEIYKHASYDLWEMNEGVHLYSLCSIYAAYDSMIKIYNELSQSFENNRLKQDDIIILKAKYEEQMRDIKKYIMENLCDKQKNVLLRNTKDLIVDISTLGAVYPFKVFSPNEKLIKNTVELINLTLRTYSGGYLRFQNDSYIGGTNPWIISTAWMGEYYKMIGDKEKVKECLKFIVNSANELGLLAEQSNSDLNQKWVIGLGWSHAMFIKLLLDEFKD